MENCKLKPRETASIVLILGILIVLSVHAWASKIEKAPGTVGPFYIKPQEVVVTIEGAVENPGRYKFKIGTTVKQAIETAKILKEADISRIKWDQEIRKARKIKVPWSRKSAGKGAGPKAPAKANKCLQANTESQLTQRPAAPAASVGRTKERILLS